MSVVNGPKSLVRDGLIFCVDVSNTKSYPGAGTDWFDISGQGNDGVLAGSVIFTTENGLPVFNVSVNGGSQITFANPDLSSSNNTVIVGSRAVTPKGRVLSGGAGSPNWLLGHWSTYGGQCYQGGWVSTQWTEYANGEIWNIYGCTCVPFTLGDYYEFYINSELIVANANGSSGPNGLRVSGYSPTGEKTECRVSFILAYDRVLTATEIADVFEVYNGRFGL
tara:strand:- start:488 stop:1153 length:666 start_codon:yes stop_codon:yes gene_type:complete